MMMPDTPDMWWPQQEPNAEVAAYSYDATGLITSGGVVDPMTSVSIACKPYGAGEIVLSHLSILANNIISVWLSGGVSGRVYLYELIVHTQGGFTYPVFIGQKCSPVIAVNPLPPAPTPGFGPAVNYP